MNIPYNPDTGRMHLIADAKYMIIGMSKCGTTTMYQSLNAHGITIKYHSDYTLERVYKTKELTTKHLLKLAKNPQLFVSYREPISRRISQHHQYKFTVSLKDFCLGDYSSVSDGYRTEIDEDMVYTSIADVTGINVLDHPFDKELGYTKIDNITFYNLESIDALAASLEMVLIDGRRTNRGKPNLSFTDKELDEVYSSKYCQHFYTKQQIEEFKLWAKD